MKDRDKVIEILKKCATQAITSELNPDELDNEGYEMFADEILALDEWISVEDGFPPIMKHNTHGYSDTVMIWTDDEYTPGIKHGSYNHLMKRWVASDNKHQDLFDKINFTHWTPLPDKPKTEKG